MGCLKPRRSSASMGRRMSNPCEATPRRLEQVDAQHLFVARVPKNGSIAQHPFVARFEGL